MDYLSHVDQLSKNRGVIRSLAENVSQEQAKWRPAKTRWTFLEAMKAKYEGDFGFDPEFYQRAWDTGEFVLLRMDPR